MPERTSPPYRREIFLHGLNLGFLTAAGIAGFYDPNLWFLAMPVEAALLWILPDLPPIKMWVDKRHQAEALAEERRYYLEQLWGLNAPDRKPPFAALLALFVESPPDNPDLRVQARGSSQFQAYLEMRTIVNHLRELVGVRGVHLTDVELGRCEQVINGYLRLLIACRPLERAVSGGDLVKLDEDIAEVDEKLAEADGPVRAVLTERRQLLAQQRERLPRLEATLHLFRARSEAIVQQLRNIHGQVLADPGMNVNEMLDMVMDRQEAIAGDPLQHADADRIVEEFLRRPAVKAKLEPEGGKKPPPRQRA